MVSYKVLYFKALKEIKQLKAKVVEYENLIKDLDMKGTYKRQDYISLQKQLDAYEKKIKHLTNDYNQLIDDYKKAKELVKVLQIRLSRYEEFST